MKLSPEINGRFRNRERVRANNSTEKGNADLIFLITHLLCRMRENDEREREREDRI